jgi:taurine dioxygenase
MNIDLLSGACGAEISGISLKDTSNTNISKIKSLLFEHKVIFFRDQNITEEEQINLSKCFGSLETHAYVKGLKKFPEIVRIIKEPYEKNNWGEGWHSDVSYNKQPTLAVILKSIQIPPIGGDTMFSNMELAYDTLDDDLKNIIKNKKAVHDSRGSEFFTKDYESMTSNGNLNIFSNEHPIIRTNPDSNKKLLYVNTTYTRKIVGMDKEESDNTLNALFKHQQRLDLTCRFKWTPNAVAIWDNRSVLHYAIADYFPNRGLGYRRVMDRIAIRGEKPF